MSFAWQCLFTATSLSGENTRSLEPETKQATSVISAVWKKQVSPPVILASIVSLMSQTLDLLNTGILKEVIGLAPIFPDTFYRLTHYWFAAADIPVANDIPVHCADAIRCNVRRPPQGSLPLLTRQVLA